MRFPRPRNASIRTRLAALVLAASAVVVGAVSLLLLRDQQLNGISRLDARLKERIDVVQSSLSSSAKLPYTEPYGQVIDVNFTMEISPAVPYRGLLSQSQADFVFRNGLLSFQRVDTNLGGEARFRAERRAVNGSYVVIAVGSGLDTIQTAHSRLLWTLLLGGPLLLVFAGFGGWVLAGAALRPVRRMTDDAATISRFESSARLAVPVRHDEIHHLAATLNDMLARLEASYRRERAFVDDASHELRTPLAVLRGELELALLRPQDAQGTAQTLQRSLDEVDRLSAMTDDLLVLARAAHPATAPNGDPTGDRAPVATPLLAAAREAVERASTLFPDRVAITIAGTEAEVTMSRDDIARVVANLLTNAARFAGRSVHVEIRHGATEATLSVRDDGPGFPPDFLGHAFERFSVASGSRARVEGGGTGLGLAIVRALTERAGGTAEAANPTEGGAEVTIHVPLAGHALPGPSATG